MEINIKEALQEVCREQESSDDEDTASKSETANIPGSSQIRTKVNEKLSMRQLQARRKLLALLAMHIQNFQRVILMSRHRFHQRMRRRQALLRTFYVQQMLELETSFLEMLPLPVIRSEIRTITTKIPKNKIVIGSDGRDVLMDKASFYEHAIIHFSKQRWLNTFRMSRTTFRWLCKQLQGALQPNSCNAPIRNLISLERRVALAVFAFASGDDYRTVAALFGVSRASVCKFVHRFAEAFLKQLGHCLLAMPRNAEEYKEIRSALHQTSNMPAVVVGVLGSCALPVIPVAEEMHLYNSNAFIVLEALVDDRKLFRKVQLEPKRPTLFLKAPNEVTNLPAQLIRNQLINELEVPSFIIVPSSFKYPLHPWLQQRYADPVAPHEYDFNEAVDSLLGLQLEAFTRLLSRWRILQRKSDLEPRTMERIALACCALHNLLEENEETFCHQWTLSVDLSRLNTNFAEKAEKETADLEEALEIRDFLARTISCTEI